MNVFFRYLIISSTQKKKGNSRLVSQRFRFSIIHFHFFFHMFRMRTYQNPLLEVIKGMSVVFTHHDGDRKRVHGRTTNHATRAEMEGRTCKYIPPQAPPLWGSLTSTPTTQKPELGPKLISSSSLPPSLSESHLSPSLSSLHKFHLISIPLSLSGSKQIKRQA